jgi:hypothetical protein
MAQSKSSFVLDTSLLALRRGESSADRFEGLITRRKGIDTGFWLLS